MILEFILNHRPVTVETAPDRRLIDLLREDLGLTGTKEGCGTGECGACTIQVDGQTKLACLMLAAQVDGRTVITIEGLTHPIQAGFEACGAVQCGFCTPGMAMSLSTYLDAHPEPDRKEIQGAISGNLCRCTGYQKIVDAGLWTAKKIKEDAHG